MEEFRHPPVELHVGLSANLERAFAQRAYATLETYSGIEQDKVFGEPVRFPKTDRIDMAVPEDAETMVAMRLVGTPVSALSGTGATAIETLAYKESDSYIVVELQYGELQEDEIEDAPEDDDYDWRSYIVVVIDPRHPYNPSVLNAETGEPLSAGDLMYAGVILDQVCAELDSLSLDAALHGDLDITPKDGLGYQRFDADDFMLTNACETCSLDGTPCMHLPGTLN